MYHIPIPGCGNDHFGVGEIMVQTIESYRTACSSALLRLRCNFMTK